MFCNHCGTEVQADFNVCPRCGKAVQAPRTLAPSRLEGHLRVLGILWMVVGGLTLVPALVLMFLSSVVHIVLPFSDALARDLGPLVMMIIGASLLFVGAGGLLVGWGLTHHQPWARVAAIVVGALALFHPPMGTLLGIYTLWVLLSQNASLEYDRLARVG
jgi:zinc-ribbon domain